MKKIILLLFSIIPVVSFALGNVEKSITVTLGKSFSLDPIYDVGITSYWDQQKASFFKFVVEDELAFSKEVLQYGNSSHKVVKLTPNKKGVYLYAIWIRYNDNFYCASYHITIDEVTQIGIPSEINMTLGENYKIKPKLYPDGVESTITYAIGNSSVATVTKEKNSIGGYTNNGIVTAIGVGTTTITCTASNGVSAQSTIRVNPILANNVFLNHQELTIEEGCTETLVASVSPDNTTNKEVVWSSSYPAVVLVGTNGVIAGLKAGWAVITATTADGSNKSATCLVNVTAKPIYIESISLNKESLSMTKGEKTQLTASVYPNNATNRRVNWSSSNNSVATVDGYGLIQAKQVGNATITCRAADGSGKYATCYVKVESDKVSVNAISLNKTSASLEVGETLQLIANVTPSSATNKSVEWSSNSNSVATVSSSGLISARSAGTAIITCKAKDGSGKTATCYVTVKEKVAPTAIVLSQTKAVIVEGETLQLNATVQPANASDKSLSWMSDNTNVATVGANGLVVAKSAGTANIIVTTANHLAAVCQLTVKAKSQGVKTDWCGRYRVKSKHVENNPTREYPDEFEMVIEEKDSVPCITTFFGENLLRVFSDGALKLHDNGNGTATVDLNENSLLRYTSFQDPLYELYVYDDAADDWALTWKLKKNEDGSLSLSTFCVASFTWSATEEKWTNGKLEAMYYDVTAERIESTGVKAVETEKPEINVIHGSLRLGKEVNVSVYKDNGALVYSGKTSVVENLPNGVYIVRIGNYAQKVFVK